MIQRNQSTDICPLGYWNPSVDHPELMKEEEPGKTVAELLRKEMFHYAKSNMALVNVYIKVSVYDNMNTGQENAAKMTEMDLRV